MGEQSSGGSCRSASPQPGRRRASRICECCGGVVATADVRLQRIKGRAVPSPLVVVVVVVKGDPIRDRPRSTVRRVQPASTSASCICDRRRPAPGSRCFERPRGSKREADAGFIKHAMGSASKRGGGGSTSSTTDFDRALDPPLPRRGPAICLAKPSSGLAVYPFGLAMRRIASRFSRTL
jgi:hypothetical protein